ncbi:hypothetical protein A4X06_0g2805 [Tilletia controversa]|uniref:Zinc/iron permease n=1 Tax=Tilletia controversa TaxID=13291 RepID=A0A8X7MWZ8_9BASI|nr:hypothetical protein CF328_g3380 [Tilletia controversa]KAE8251123.1 hypothetical protein A4X06_0g2805 [Tilletia controversa]CAD6981638.1 unnamed protein product [Tilletia controversa]
MSALRETGSSVMKTMSPLAQLLIFCLVMAISTFLLGSLPLFIRLSHRQMILLQSLAAGLLLGAGITIVLPEGVSNLYAHYHPHNHAHKNAKQHYDPEHTLGVSVLVGFLLMYFADRFLNSSQPHTHSEAQPPSLPPTAQPSSSSSSTTAGAEGEGAESPPPPNEMHRMSHPSSPRKHHDHRQQPSSAPLRLSSLRLFAQRSSSLSTFSRASLTSLLGLVIHAFTDGIAMGAASLASSASASSSNTEHQEEEEDPAASLRLIVFLAIMLHKAPAALGLSTLLLSQAGSRLAILRAIGVFSLSTPAGALATYALGWYILDSKAVDGLGAPSAAALDARGPIARFASVLVRGLVESGAEEEGDASGGGGGGGLSTRHIGMALTFSAGTFLYVAMHALGELMGSPSSSSSPHSSSSHEHQHHGYQAVDAEDHLGDDGVDEEGRRRRRRRSLADFTDADGGGAGGATGDNESSSLLHPHPTTTNQHTDSGNRRRVVTPSTSSPTPAPPSATASPSQGDSDPPDPEQPESKRQHQHPRPSTRTAAPPGWGSSSILTLEAAKTALLLLGAALPRFLQGLTGHGH